MLYLITGTRGSGMTLLGVHFGAETIKEGRPVLSNVNMVIPGVESDPYIGLLIKAREEGIQGTTLVWDSFESELRYRGDGWSELADMVINQAADPHSNVILFAIAPALYSHEITRNWTIAQYPFVTFECKGYDSNSGIVTAIESTHHTFYVKHLLDQYDTTAPPQ